MVYTGTVHIWYQYICINIYGTVQKYCVHNLVGGIPSGKLTVCY